MNTTTLEKFTHSSGTLRSGDRYVIGFLNVMNLDSVIKLQEMVHNSLKENDKTFLLVKPQEYFENHFKSGGKLLGIWTESGDLIAQSIIVTPDRTHPETGMVDMKPVGAPETVTVLQGVLVHPDYRGNGLMGLMVRHWLDYAAELGRTHAVAEIDARNFYSWRVFAREGLNIVGIGRDQSDGTRVYNAHETIANIQKKRLKSVFNAMGMAPRLEAGHKNVQLQSALFAMGFVGVDYNDGQKTMVMMHKTLLKEALAKAAPDAPDTAHARNS